MSNHPLIRMNTDSISPSQVENETFLVLNQLDWSHYKQISLAGYQALF